MGQPATDLEAEFREIRKIMHCRRELAFYSVQRLILEREARKRVLAQVDARKTFECEVVRCERRVARAHSDLETAKEALASVPAPTQAPATTGEVLRGKQYVVKSWVHMSAQVGKISDTFSTAHIASHNHTFDRFRRCWTEQHATFDGRPAAFDHSGKIKIAFVLRLSMWSRNSEMTWKSGKTNLSPLLQFCKRSSTASAYAVSKRVEVAAGSVVSQRNGRCPMVQIVHARPS